MYSKSRFSPILALASGVLFHAFCLHAPLEGRPPADQPATLDPFVEEAEAESRSILPLDDGPPAGFSLSGRWLDIPRSATRVTAAVREAFGVDDLEAAVVFTPGALATAQFGHVTTPTVRGDAAETYLDGMRRSNNLFGYKPSFNAVETLEVVRGPAPAGFGPGFLSGGYVNLQTKRADLFEDRNRVVLRAGRWQPGGGSFADLGWEVDLSRVLERGRSGWRLSYGGGDSATRFADHPAAEDGTHSLYFSWRHRGTDAPEWRVSGEWMVQAAPQLLGVNRPSPELFEGNQYFSGTPTFIDGAFVIADNARGRVGLPEDATFLSDDDRSRAEVAWAQLQVEAPDVSALRWSNRTLVEWVDRERFHEFEYAEYVEQRTLENRTELTWETRVGGLSGRYGSGLSLRLEDRLSFVNFFNEIPFAYDLSAGGTNHNIREQYPSLVVPGIPGPDGLEFFGLPFSPESTDSRLLQAGWYVEGRQALPGGARLMAGVRIDAYHAEARDPVGPSGATDRLRTGAWSGNLSVLVPLGPRHRLYLAWNDSNAVEGSIAGGGIMLNAAGRVNPDNLDNRSRLFEAGWRAESEDGRQVVALAVFQQDRRRVEIRGPRSDLRLHGVELEWLAQPREGWKALVNLTWTDGEYRDSAPSQLGGRSLYDLYAVGYGPGGRGTGAGYDFFFLNQVPAGDYPIPGLSEWMVKAALEAPLGRGWSLAVWGDWLGSRPGNLDREYHIPSSLLVNGALNFRHHGWRASIRVLNLLDATRWNHNGQTFFNNQLVSRGAERGLELEIARRF